MHFCVGVSLDEHPPVNFYMDQKMRKKILDLLIKMDFTCFEIP